MKKALAFLMAAVMLMSMLTACGNKDVADDTKDNNDVNTEETDKAAADKVAALIDAIYVQERTEETDAQCEAAKAAWDALTDAQKALVEGEEASPEYFGLDTGDASKDDPRNQDEIGEKELLVVSFGTSFNDSRVADIKSIEDALQHMKGGYDVVPANIMLAGAEQELSQTGKEHRLKEAVAPIAGNYDFIVIDTPPSLGVLTVNAFTCATDILIPTTAGIFATAGISQLNETVASVQRYCNPGVKIRGILFTRFNPRANISRQMKELAEQLGEYISAPIYKTYIRSAVVVEEAQANRQDIFDYADKSTVSEDYRAFIEEFLKGVNE